MAKKTTIISIIVLLVILAASFSVWKFVLNKPEQPKMDSATKQASQIQPVPTNQNSTPTQANSPKSADINDDDKETDSILKEITQEEPSADPASK